MRERKTVLMYSEKSPALLITESYPPQPGGVACSARRNALFLKRACGEVQVFTISRTMPPGFTEIRDDEGITINSLGAFKHDDRTLQVSGNIVSHLCRTCGFPVLHGYYGLFPGYLAVFYAKMTGTRSLVNIRGNDVDRGMFDKDYHSFLTWTLSHADAVTCVSEELAKKCSILSSRDDIHYTPNSVDSRLFMPGEKNRELMEQLHIEDRFVIGFFGELRFKKGAAFIIEAFRELAPLMPVTLLIVGRIRKSEKAALDEILKTPLRSRIVHVDYVHEPSRLCQYYNLADVVVSPSLWEGMPNSVLEAMACGRIVLSSDAGGARDIIENGENGFLLGCNELHRLAQAIADISRLDGDRRSELCCRARERVMKNFSPEREYQSLMNIYSLLMGKREESSPFSAKSLKQVVPLF